MKNKNLLYGGFLVLSVSIMTSFEKDQDPKVHHLKCIGGTGEDGIFLCYKTKGW